MKQPLETVIVRLHGFRRACRPDDYETFKECFDHVARTSGRTQLELVREMRVASSLRKEL